MLKVQKPYLSLLLVILFWSDVCAQAQSPAQPTANIQSSAPWVTATATATNEHLRFAASAEVYEMRLEVFTAAGEKIFDSDFKPGNLLDWPLQDQQGQRLADGSYRCVVTVKNLAGALTQKHGGIKLEAGVATLQKSDDETQTFQPANGRNVVNRDALLAILREGATRATAVLAHDGSIGRVVSTSGGLSFRLGDFFAGKDVERMRLTPEGNLGVGVANPQARLDVAGLIRTSEGVMFPDGTIQTTAAGVSSRTVGERSGINRTSQPREVSAAASVLAPNISGSGTTNFITKWLDGPSGVVGDSAIFQGVNGKIGIGMMNPSERLSVNGSLQVTGANRVYFGDAGTGEYIYSERSGRFPLIFVAGFQPRLTLANDGNIGVGTTFPVAKLHVLGDEFRLEPTSLPNTPLCVPNPELGRLCQVISLTSAGLLSSSLQPITVNAAAGTFINPTRGNVGIGTTSPGGKLHVSSGSDFRSPQIVITQTTALDFARLQFRSFGIDPDRPGIPQPYPLWDIAAGRGVLNFFRQGTGNVMTLTTGLNPGATVLSPRVGIGVENPQATLHVNGAARVGVLQITGGSDLSEQFEVKAVPDSDHNASPQWIQPGLVVSIDPDNPGKLVVSGQAYDRRVAGIISGAGGVNPGMLMSQAGSVADGNHPVALTGRVYCWADASNGPINPGDLLTTSNIPGHAMKVTDHAKAQGAIIGKAMTRLRHGKGLVLILVNLQ